MGILRKLVQILADAESKTEEKKTPVRGLAYDDVIRNHQDRERQINDMLADQIEKIKSIEAELKKVFALYDQASPAEKKTYAVRIRSLNSDLETQGELRVSYEFKLKQEKAIIAKLQLNRVNSGMKIDQEEVDHIIEDALAAAAENEMASDKIEMLDGIRYHDTQKKRRRTAAELKQKQEQQQEQKQEQKQEDESISAIRGQISFPEVGTETAADGSDSESEEIENIRKQSNLL